MRLQQYDALIPSQGVHSESCLANHPHRVPTHDLLRELLWGIAPLSVPSPGWALSPRLKIQKEASLNTAVALS